jgi:hypothetical protein
MSIAVRRLLLVFVCLAYLTTFADRNSVAGQEPVQDDPPSVASAGKNAPNAPMRDLAELRAEAISVLDSHNSQRQWDRIVPLYREILKHPENNGRELLSDLARVLNSISDEDEQLDEVIDLCELAVQSHPHQWPERSSRWLV